jgi:hypothetical protein
MSIKVAIGISSNSEDDRGWYAILRQIASQNSCPLPAFWFQEDNISRKQLVNRAR